MIDGGFKPEKMLRPDIAELEPYTPIQPFSVLSRRLGFSPDQIVKLDANENPYGPVPAVVQALAEYAHYHIYPDPDHTELREALSDYLDVPHSMIMATHGADEMLDYLCRMFIEPANAVVNCPPTFGMYRFDATVNRAHVIDVWRNKDFSVDIDTIVEQVAHRQRALDREPANGSVKVVFLASPNNPSGNWLPDNHVQRLLELPVLLVLDEAYVEFSERQSRVSLVKSHENLVVVRTFSKVAGMAGLRLGYAVCPEWLMQHLWKFKQPYNVNVAATVAGLASLRSRPQLEAASSRIRMERDRLYSLLDEIPVLDPWPSEANFILCKVHDGSAVDLKRNLERKGVMVRYYSSPGLEDYIRISVGRPEHTDRLMEVLQEITKHEANSSDWTSR
jgi:histidinol-phosphate aminotransferase